jgi:hypothetical protein
MRSEEINDLLKFISKECNIKYIDILHTLSKYSILPPGLRKTYNKLSNYKYPAIKLIAEKYNIETPSVNGKLKMIHLKDGIKIAEEEYKKNISVKYLYLVFSKYLGISIASQIIKSDLEKYIIS